MKLKKQIISVIIAFCMAVTILPADMQYKVMAAETEETTLPGHEGEDITEPTPEDNGIEPVTHAGETSQVILNVITADTYYSLDGKFPMYVEYFVKSENITSEEREKLSLSVTKEDGSLVASVTSNSDENYFTIPECNGIVNGDSYNLTFTITDTSSGGSDVIWTETRTVLFTDKNVWASCEYFPTGETSYDINLYDLENTSLDGNVDAVCLIDKDGQVAARTDQSYFDEVKTTSVTYDKRYEKIFSNTFPGLKNNISMLLSSCTVYRTRKLEAGEKLYIGYQSNGEIKKSEDAIFTVTDQPYIPSANFSLYDNIYASEHRFSIYPGMENADVIQVEGYNIDFNKLSFEIQDRGTDEVVGYSTNYALVLGNSARYCMQWKEGEKRDTDASYNIIYNYIGSETGFIIEDKQITYFSHNDRNNGLIWNLRTESMEYYNEEVPVGSVISYEVKDNVGSSSIVYASGNDIPVGKNHLVTIQLKGLEKGHYYLIIKYKDADGNEKITSNSIYIDETGLIYNYYLSKQQYLSDTKEFEFIANLSCSDASILEPSCTADIYNETSKNKEGTVELILKNDNGKLSYSGNYNNVLDIGKYSLSFKPYGNNKYYYEFFVEDKDRLSICSQVTDSDSGTATIYFGSKEIADCYCGDGNSKLQDKLIIKAFDIQKNEIGVYKYSNGDFAIENNGHYNNIRTIHFSDKIKQELNSYYYCNIYFYYGEGIEEETIAIDAYNPDRNFYNINFSDSVRYSNWIVNDNSKGSIELGISYNDNRPEAYYLYNYLGYDSFNTVLGSESAFPAVVKITDWYSLETIKEITVNETGHIFTESEMEGLSSDKLYNFFIQGADGSIWRWWGYLDTSSAAPDDGTGDTGSSKPSPTPSPAPTKSPVNWGGGGWIYVPEITTTPEPTIQPDVTATPEPTLTPEPVPSPAVTLEPSAAPEITAVPEPTPEPVPTVKPEESAPPSDNTETIKDNITNPTDQWELSLKKKKIKLKKGQKAKIKITSELNTKVVYKSLKPSVATVNKNGVVTAKKNGKAVITVKANGKVCKVTVTVKGIVKEASKETVKVPANASVIKLGKNFKLAKTKITIKKGKKLVIQKAAGIPEKVTFVSLDRKIASVSANGVIKAKKKGKTTILIKKGKKTIKLKITVKK